MASSVEADSSKPTEPQDAAELPAADAQTQVEETGAQPLDVPVSEHAEGEQADAAAAPAPAGGDAQEVPQLSVAGEAQPDTPATAGRGTGKRGRGTGRGGQRGTPRARGQAKRGNKDAPDTDPEEDGGNTEGGLQTRRSSRQSKKPKTFAQEFIAEPGSESPEGKPEETDEAADAKENKEQQPAAKSEPSQDSDEMPLVKAIQTAAINVEVAAEAAQAEQPQEAKTPRTFARRKKSQEAAQEEPSVQAAEKAEAHAEEAKSPRARKGKSQEAGQLSAAAGAAEPEDSAQPLEPRSPKAKRKRQSDADQQDDASDQAPGTEGKQAARKRRRAKTAPAPGKAGKGAGAGRRNTKSREATPEVHGEAEGAPAGHDQAAGQQRAATGAAGQQAMHTKTGPVSELEHIREGLQKAEEAHERKLGELRHLDAQVKGYMEHLSRMDLTIDHLTITGIGKTVRRFTNGWPKQREHSLKSSQESASDPAKALILKFYNVAGVSHPKAAKPTAASVPARTGEAKDKQVAQPEQEAPKEKAPAQPGQALPAQTAQQPAQAIPQPTSQPAQAAATPAAAPVKREEPKVVSIGFKQELPAPVRKPQPSRADANHSTGSAVRDKALEILLRALTPDEALSREEAAKKLEAALYASCTNGKAAGQSGQPAEPGVTYMRRLRVLWSWLDGSSPHRSPGLKRLFIEGKVAAPELATMDARRVRDLTEPPAPSATPQPGSQQDVDGAFAGAAPGSADAPFLSEGPPQSMDIDVDLPGQGPAVPGLPGQGIAVSALPSQELLAKLQLFCEGTLQVPHPTSSHLQGFVEPLLEQTVGEIVQHQEAALRACQAGQATAEQLHGVIAAGRLLERSLGTAGQPAAAQQQLQPLLPPEEAQLQLLPFAQAALAALARASSAPGQPASAPSSAPLRTALPPQAAASVHASADEALHLSAPTVLPQPMDCSSAPGYSQEGTLPNGDAEGLQEGGAPDLAAALPTSPPRTPVLGGAVPNGSAPLAGSAIPDSSVAGDNHFANMHTVPSLRQGWRSDERPIPSVPYSQTAKHMHANLAGVLHAQQSSGAVGSSHVSVDNGAMSAQVDAEHHEMA